ncbi:MAG TPA: LuxR C-terminal-related transcriptional regulator [Ktedonobacteraceae bacterium]|nr:LuxR C-terminal-related transcriptional regulator [Ktedonobacteraceae bacterium]
MPKVPIYTLAWLPGQTRYELYETRSETALPIMLNSPTWFTWLQSVSSFAFIGKHGFYTARKETRPRGEHYWYAYLTQGKHLSKKYLGKTSNLTLARLESLEEIVYTQHENEHALLFPSATPHLVSGTDGTPQPALPSQSTPLHPLLITKLHIPHPRPQLVVRTHLIERLRLCAQLPLTLISAPAGSGKTTLLAQSLWESNLPVAWLSLEPEDNDPARFLPYMIFALQTLDPQLGTTILSLLRTPQPPPPEMVLTLLINEILEQQTKDMILVLDDYHVITSASLRQAMILLLEHLPPQLHLILATRTDPSLPLARLRAQGRLAEIRASDLRFAGDEIRTFLQIVMKLELSLDIMTTLEARTEGWITGLQLAALSLQGKTDITGFVTGFTGTHRFVLDYLSEEVLMQQPPLIQSFLLHTSLLDRLNGPLCNALTGREESQEMLEKLEKANLFVVALDEIRCWYRYHHLFAETLRSYLQQREPAMVPVLHQRASEWYEQHALPLEAVHHALAIPDEERAIRLLEPIVIPFAFRGQRSIVLKWLNALPNAVIRTHSLLCVYYASLLMLTNQFEAAMVRLTEAEDGLGEDTSTEQARIIRGFLFTNRSTIAFFSGDLQHSILFAHQALALLPETEDSARAGNLTNIVQAYQISGDTTVATELEIAKTVATIRILHNPFALISCIAMLAHLHALQGRLQQASATYAQIMEIASSPEMLQITFAGPYYYFGLGDLLRERNDLDTAEHYLRQGLALIHEDIPLEARVATQGYFALASLLQARGNTSEARITLDALLSLAHQRHFAASFLAQGTARRVRFELTSGNLTAAVHWAETCGLSLNDTDLPFPRESEYLTLARISIAQKKLDLATFSLQEVLLLLTRLHEKARAGARLGSVLEILVVRTLALEAQGDQAAALTILKQALLLARPEGYIRLFVDEGLPMLALLRHLSNHHLLAEYITTLLNAFGEPQFPDVSPPLATVSPLTEPLTEREREVLALLLEGASNREIAHRLVLSVNTVKRHVYNICGKLGAQSRMQVVTKARSLNFM